MASEPEAASSSLAKRGLLTHDNLPQTAPPNRREPAANQP